MIALRRIDLYALQYNAQLLSKRTSQTRRREFAKGWDFNANN